MGLSARRSIFKPLEFHPEIVLALDGGMIKTTNLMGMAGMMIVVLK